MDSVWLLLGVVVLGATLLDVFLTALNFDEAGFIAGPHLRTAPPMTAPRAGGR